MDPYKKDPIVFSETWYPNDSCLKGDDTENAYKRHKAYLFGLTDADMIVCFLLLQNYL